MPTIRERIKQYTTAEQGWKKGEGNTLEPEWSCGPILPSSLTDLLEKTVEEIEEREPDDNQDPSYDEIFSEE